MKSEKKRALREIDAPFYTVFQALILSFYSSRLYIDVGKRWKGIGMRYLFLVIILFSLPFNIRVILEVNRFFEEEIVDPIRRIPDLYIRNGKIALDKPTPYFIKNKKEEIVAIIDPTGVTSRIDNKKYPKLTTLITKDKVYYRTPSAQLFFTTTTMPEDRTVYVQSLEKFDNEIFNGTKWIESINLSYLKLLLGVVMASSIIFSLFVIHYISYLLLALMGQFVAKLFFHLTLSYKQSLRLMIVSATPQVVLFMICLACNYYLPGFNYILFILLSTYFCFALLAVRRESHKLVIR